MKEREITEKIKAYLKSVDKLFFWKQFGGQYSTVGIPDLIICYKSRFIAFRGKSRKRQDLRSARGVIAEDTRGGRNSRNSTERRGREKRHRENSFGGIGKC
jgi:hypothetical protein